MINPSQTKMAIDPKGLSPLSSTLDGCCKSTEVLSQALDKLTSKLEPVLRSSSPRPEKVDESPSNRSPVVARLKGLDQTLIELTGDISDLLDRLDV